MKLRLLSLQLDNFKGIRHLSIAPDGDDLDIFGDNATGKTTVADAFYWLLFGKDSAGQAKFDIKTLTPEGDVEHGLEHSVEADLAVDDEPLTLRKTYKEEWTKKRGARTASFTGHTVDYYLDGVPVKKSEYDARIAEIADEETFRLLTDPYRFNALHWQKRREVLLEVCGDVSDDEVVAAEAELGDLPDILGQHSVEDYRKIATATRRKINEELETIPVRIDEARRAAPEHPASDADSLARESDALRKEHQALLERRASASAEGEVAEKRALIRELERERGEIRAETGAKLRELEREARGAYHEARGAASEQSNEVERLRRRDGELRDEARRLGEAVEHYRARWREVNAAGFEGDEVCPTCGQTLPAEQVEKAREEHNAWRANELEEITTEGKRSATALAHVQSEIEQLADAMEAAWKELAARAVARDEAQERLTELTGALAKAPEDVDTSEIDAKIAALEAEVESGSAEGATAEIDERIVSTMRQLEAVDTAIARWREIERVEARVRELSERERELAREYDEVERHLHLLDLFIRTKVRLLEERIGERFELARFKLFDEQINGGITETCVTSYRGVPYDSLNHGARLNIGIDIINTLADHYDLIAPIFVDNAESVTAIRPSAGQAIRLIVSPNDPTLRTERSPKEAAA